MISSLFENINNIALIVINQEMKEYTQPMIHKKEMISSVYRR